MAFKSSKGYFVELGEHFFRLARTSADEGPMVIEALVEGPIGDKAAFAEAVASIQTPKNPNGYLNAYCGVHPKDRIVRLWQIDAKRIAEPEYITEILKSQFRIETSDIKLTLINPTDGTEIDAQSSSKLALFGGVPSASAKSIQADLLAGKIYPQRIELTAVAMLGSAIDLLAFEKSKSPSIFLEIDDESSYLFIVNHTGLAIARLLPHGLNSMIPALRKELGFADDAAAAAALKDGSVNFETVGPNLLTKLNKEIQDAVHFYEVQSSLSVDRVTCLSPSPGYGWVESAIARAQHFTRATYNLAEWLKSHEITFAESVEQAKSGLDFRWFGLLSLMVKHTSNAPVVEEKK